MNQTGIKKIFIYNILRASRKLLASPSNPHNYYLIQTKDNQRQPEKRTFHEKFTLKSREYKYGDKYYLVLADANDEKNILKQYEFMIDIAFVDDFGF